MVLKLGSCTGIAKLGETLHLHGEKQREVTVNEIGLTANCSLIRISWNFTRHVLAGNFIGEW